MQLLKAGLKIHPRSDIPIYLFSAYLILSFSPDRNKGLQKHLNKGFSCPPEHSPERVHWSNSALFVHSDSISMLLILLNGFTG